LNNQLTSDITTFQTSQQNFIDTNNEVSSSNVSYNASTVNTELTSINSTLKNKANLANPTFTGTLSGVTASMVGLGSVTNKSDASKPVSPAQQTALDLKSNIANPTFTGLVLFSTPVFFAEGVAHVLW
jgi:hypothetical protein